MALDDVRRWYHARDGYWFVPKMYGFGATPVTWQGWAVVLGSVAALVLDVYQVKPLVPKVVIGIAVVVTMTVIAWRKTDGDWRWRWGSRS